MVKGKKAKERIPSLFPIPFLLALSFSFLPAFLSFSLSFTRKMSLEAAVDWFFLFFLLGTPRLPLRKRKECQERRNGSKAKNKERNESRKEARYAYSLPSLSFPSFSYLFSPSIPLFSSLFSFGRERKGIEKARKRRENGGKGSDRKGIALCLTNPFLPYLSFLIHPSGYLAFLTSFRSLSFHLPFSTFRFCQAINLWNQHEVCRYGAARERNE